MFISKTGIKIPEQTDRVIQEEIPSILLDIITKLSNEVDRLTDEVNQLKGEYTAPIPERIGDEIPCKRCLQIGTSQTAENLCDSYRWGDATEEEVFEGLWKEARKCRLHDECAKNIINGFIEQYRQKK